ncbi:PKD domain-containing protein [Polaribacter aquimarinus]|uniref:PKD domain-containing protein n=1 Tax=Polaribacter aquimarinus TaxID=2100726 RepID=A0A2U2J8A8_9FLAO|nr:PKD domain-containing protein [Polaribacter aquimarinus]PWG04567.1 PKD domain-containing protein [Polaribacter aquimarinus]
MTLKNKLIYFVALLALFSLHSCDEFGKYELPEAGSLADDTPPAAKFTYKQGEGLGDIWKTYSFSNQSVSAITYSWNFGDGSTTSTESEPTHTYSGEGTWTVSLTATDGLGVSNTYTEEITVKEPPAPAVTDPVLVNADFVKQAKSSGSDCVCSGWINKSIGDQGESSSGNGSDVFKFDNDESDAAYQEFEVQANADYTITIVTQFKSLTSGGSFPSMLELRVLAGSGYVSGYTPTYYATGKEYPQDGFGYTSIPQVEDASNTLFVKVLSNPNDDGYLTTQYTFNSGANTSVALFIRGIGGDGTDPDKRGHPYNNGDEEIRLDSVLIEAL